jgi:chromate transporter
MSVEKAPMPRRPIAPAPGRVQHRGVAGRPGSAFEVLAVATRLGLTSFGGPIAHIGYFRREYVERRGWVDDQAFADLVALTQSLPGAASSKLGIAIGIVRAGLPGGLASWLGFTLPSAIGLVAFAVVVQRLGPEADGWLHGLKIVAVAVVAQAVWAMARTLAATPLRIAIAVAAALAVLALPGGATQLVAIVAAGAVGWRLLREGDTPPRPRLAIDISRRTAAIAGLTLVALLVALPILRQITGDHAVGVFDSFYRTGSLAFGGGHVVLPLLEAEVTPHWISEERFLAGYGAAQAVPGPLFTFSAYLGAAMEPVPNGVAGATLALIAIFLPSFLLTVAALPGFAFVRGRADLQAALRGVGAAVVGILLAALYDPVGTSAILRPIHAVIATAALVALVVARLPPWLVVIGTAAVTAAIGPP